MVGSKLNSFGEMQSGRQRERQSKDPTFAHVSWSERGAAGLGSHTAHRLRACVTLRLAGGPGHWAAGQDVEMQVENGLAGGGAGIEDGAMGGSMAALAG